MSSASVGVSRLLTTTGRQCPYGCTYCFAKQLAVDNRTPFASATRIVELATTADGRTLVVQPSCDTELFLDSEEGLQILEACARTSAHVSFATKAPLSKYLVDALAKVAARLRDRRRVLLVMVSFTSFRLSQILEPGVPPSSQRVQTLQRLWGAGVSTMVVLRPLLPCVPMDDIEELMDRAGPWSNGYLVGPYYSRDRDYGRFGQFESVTYGEVPWMPKSGRWYCCSMPSRVKQLSALAATRGTFLFESVLTAVRHAAGSRDCEMLLPCAKARTQNV